jgi:hypothetical protein
METDRIPEEEALREAYAWMGDVIYRLYIGKQEVMA